MAEVIFSWLNGSKMRGEVEQAWDMEAEGGSGARVAGVRVGMGAPYEQLRLVG